MKGLGWLTPVVVSALVLAGCEYRAGEVPSSTDPSMRETFTKGGRDARLWDQRAVPTATAEQSAASRSA